jgi:hypothetical protein
MKAVLVIDGIISDNRQQQRLAARRISKRSPAEGCADAGACAACMNYRSAMAQFVDVAT